MRTLLTILLSVCVTTLTLASAWAQVPTDSVRRFVQNELGTIDGASRIDISVGEADARLRLAPCEKAEPFLRSGTRLWGRTFVGLRCVSGAQWTISVPVQVRVFGPGLVAAHLLAAGQSISESDVRSEQVEWTRQPQGVARDLSQLQHRVPARPIEPGQPIGLALLSDTPAVAQGDEVKLVGRGNGFSITTDAVALASAAVGQPVRVRLESGKILTGTAREGRIVELVF
ncbi:MAG TPA: flagellar basal body P-ring formation chaperone FlgA [Burkholderiaceae bacterium]|jgi:flagella basal body P-ring formation protein FlgA|nr:flagellar basal body P-ring formation chaperone FlgA [Burkholderiaceae bacterium]